MTAPPDDATARAVHHLRRGEPEIAERIFRDILIEHPGHAAAVHHYCALLVASGRARAAQKRAEAFLRKHRPTAALHHVLAKAFEADGAPVKCLHHLRRAVDLDPRDIGPWLDLIRVEAESRQIEAARRSAATAMAQLPGDATLPLQLGIGELRNGNTDAAERQFEAALAIAPQHPAALHNLAAISKDRGAWDKAVRLFRAARAADRDGRLPPVAIDDIELRLGEVEAAIASADAWLARSPADPAVLSNRLLAAQYDAGVTPGGLLRLHRLWDARIGRPLRPAAEPWQVQPDPDRRLRVGLVSADLRDHPVAYFSIRAFEALDRAGFEVVAYDGGGIDDAMSRRFARAVATRRDTAGWADERLARQIVEDRIDLLLDLSGHIAGGRLAVFARRPAPVQITWLGYVGTTGLAAIDWLIADGHLIPPGAEADHVERVLRLPDAFACFDPPDPAPAVAPLPAGESGPLGFAAFHNPAKVNAGVIALWARVLLAEPGSTIRFAYDGYQFASVQDRLRAGFAEAGVAADRIAFHGHLPRQELLALYATADIALDPFPYGGMTTTAEALWMGVPVVTLPGATFAGRHALSHLAAAGVTGTVARDADDYVAIVHALGADRAGLAALRQGLRPRVAASPLCDGARFAAHFGAALRDIWRDWCGRPPA